MLKKRIIPCLDIKNGRTVKGVQFEGLRDAGNPVELAQRYAAEGADELVFLDISATQEKRQSLIPLVESIGEKLDIPFTVGGGVQSVADARALLLAGADKISINTAAVLRPELINEIAQAFGSQCLVVAVDAKQENGQFYVTTHGGKRVTQKRVSHWLEEAQTRGAGEFLITSMRQDGAKTGFDLDLLNEASAHCSRPIIASGGAGKQAHFAEVFQNTSSSGALAASVFHFGEIAIPELKDYLAQENIPVRPFTPIS